METLLRLFDWILATSARASLLVMVVLAIQAVVRHRVSPRWRYALWLPVLVVLLIPVCPESPWAVSSIINLAPESPLTVSSVMQPTGVLLTHTTQAETPGIPVPTSWALLLCWIWLGGAAGMVILGLGAYLHTLRRCQRDLLPASSALLSEIDGQSQAIGLRRGPRVWVSPGVHSPAVTGLLRPTLLLPAHFEQTLAPQERRFVIKHELTHLKRGDLPVHSLLCLLIAVHWYNPVLWLAFFKLRLDREAACDAQVLDRESQAGRVAYGHTLLKVETAFSPAGFSLGFVGIFQRGTALRARIQSIATPPTPHPLMKTALCLAMAFLTFLGITRAASPDPKAPQILIHAKFVEVSERNPRSSSSTPLPAPLDKPDQKVPGHIATLTDPEFQKLIRNLNQRKGLDLLSAPQMITRDRQQARFEVVREFSYKDEAERQATKKPGVTLSVTPKLKKTGEIALDVSSQVMEFEGFLPHKKSGWQEPIFNVRKARLNAAVLPGQTVVLEMEPRIDKQQVEETDGAGRTIKSETVSFQRRLLVFVTVEHVGPPPLKKTQPQPPH